VPDFSGGIPSLFSEVDLVIKDLAIFETLFLTASPKQQDQAEQFFGVSAFGEKPFSTRKSAVKFSEQSRKS
jgi:hypothetical protein